MYSTGELQAETTARAVAATRSLAFTGSPPARQAARPDAFGSLLSSRYYDDSRTLTQVRRHPQLPIHSGRCGGRLDAENADIGIPPLERHRDARDQAPTTDRHDHHVHLGEIVVDFEAQGPLPGDQLEVVEGMDVGEAPFGDELFRLLVGFIPDGPMEDHLGTVGAGRLDLRRRGVFRHA